MNKLNSGLIALVCVFAVVSSAHSNDDLLELCEPYEIIGGPHAGVYHGWFYPNGNRIRQTLIVIEETESGYVIAKWAHGEQPKWRVEYKDCHLSAGKYSGEKIELELHTHSKGEYVFNPNGKVKAVYTSRRGNRTKGKLKKATEK